MRAALEVLAVAGLLLAAFAVVFVAALALGRPGEWWDADDRDPDQVDQQGEGE